jgi:soluble lytic murein transglycosylase-like protein
MTMQNNQWKDHRDDHLHYDFLQEASWEKAVFYVTLILGGYLLWTCEAKAANCPQYREEISLAARTHLQHPRVLDALVWEESRCLPRAVSKAGALGLGQLLHPAARGGLTRKQLFDPARNLQATAKWMAYLQIYCGEKIMLWLPAYNTGRCGVGKKYARRILRRIGR